MTGTGVPRGGGLGEARSAAAGSGRTRERWAAFADLAGEDLSLARLAEGHADAVAILAELDGPPPLPGSRWGVWAAHPPGPKLEAGRHGGGWRLHGTKRYCSGRRCCTHALVTAAAPDGIPAVRGPVGGAEPGTGHLARHRHGGQRHLDVDFAEAAAQPVGAPGGVHGAAGFRARRRGRRRLLVRRRPRGRPDAAVHRAAERDVGPHALAHLGAVDIALRTVRTALDVAADEIDADPADLKDGPSSGRCGSVRSPTPWRRR